MHITPPGTTTSTWDGSSQQYGGVMRSTSQGNATLGPGRLAQVTMSVARSEIVTEHNYMHHNQHHTKKINHSSTHIIRVNLNMTVVVRRLV